MRTLGLCLLALCFLAPSSVLAAKKKKAPTAKQADRPKSPPKPLGPPQVIFTFDDGPAGERTVKVLDLLDQYKIKAVFFVNGWHFQGTNKAAEREKAVVRETAKRGHIIGNHTVHHYFLCGKVYSKNAAAEIEDNAKLIEEVVGKRPPLYRTPFGAHCAALSAVHDKLGVQSTGWDLDPEDWKLKNGKKIEDRVISQLRSMRGKNILLLHDIQAGTVEALPKILAWLDHENQQRRKAGTPEIQILDPSVLLTPAPKAAN